MKPQRVDVLESRAVRSLPHLLRSPLQVDAAHNVKTGVTASLRSARVTVPIKGIVLPWMPGGIRDPQHFEVGKRASKWAAFQIRKRALAVQSRNHGA